MHSSPLTALTRRAAMLCAAISLAPAAHAWPVTYRLTADAVYAEGCFGMCACPVWSTSIIGRFRLHPVTIAGTVDTYAVTNVHWFLPGIGEQIFGDGTYTQFNEFAALNRMELDLEVGSDPVEHFDSGMVPVGAPFPRINVTISIHGMMRCYDTVIDVDAKPVFGDVTDDAIVNIDDLLTVLNSWGACPAPPNACPGDVAPEFSGNGTVDIDDLLLVIANWGQ